MGKVASPKSDHRDIAATMAAAENTRCVCGDYGSWDRTIGGTSGPGMSPCVWASCPNCRGTAIGAPLLAAEYREANRIDPRTMAFARAVAYARRCGRAGYEVDNPHDGWDADEVVVGILDGTTVIGSYTVTFDGAVESPESQPTKVSRPRWR